MVFFGDHILRGAFAEDASSTLVFDRNALKRTAESRDRALHELVFDETQGDDPLVCVTAKRLRLESAILPLDALMRNYAERAARAAQQASASSSGTAPPQPGTESESGGGVVV